MKRLLLISSFMQMVTINSYLHPMQSCSSAQSAQSSKALTVRITGTSDGIDVVIPERDARTSKGLEEFLNFSLNSLPSTEENVWPLTGAFFSSQKFNSFDIKKMGSYLNAITHENENIEQLCHSESIDNNIKQLLLADYFNIEKLLKAEVSAIAQKFNNQNLLPVYRDNPDLSQLMQSIPENIQEEIIKDIVKKVIVKQYEFTESHKATLSPDGKSVVTWSLNKNPRIYNTRTGQLIHELNEQSRVWAAQFSPDGTKIVITSAGRIANIWDTHTGKLLYSLVGQTNLSSKAIFSFDGKMVLTTYGNTEFEDVNIRFWHSQTGEPAAILHEENDIIETISAPINNYIIMRPLNGEIKVRNFTQELSILEKSQEVDRNLPYSALFSHDANQIYASNGNTMRVWDTHTGQLIQIFCGTSKINDYIKSMAISANNKIAIASKDGTIGIWNVGESRPICSITHESEINYLSFSADGNYIITAHNDRTARIWDANNGRLKEIIKHEAPVCHAEFTNNDRNIMTMSDDEIVHIWACDKEMLPIEADNNQHALEQALFIQCVSMHKQSNQILDLDTAENIPLKTIFETFNEEKQKYLKKINRIESRDLTDDSKDSAASSSNHLDAEESDNYMVCTIQ